MTKELLTADEVASVLRVDRQRIYFLVRQQLIPHIKIGHRQIRFSAEAIEYWLSAGGNQMDSRAYPNQIEAQELSNDIFGQK
jgi:excisionase family DNA binding protein